MKLYIKTGRKFAPSSKVRQIGLVKVWVRRRPPSACRQIPASSQRAPQASRASTAHTAVQYSYRTHAHRRYITCPSPQVAPRARALRAACAEIGLRSGLGRRASDFGVGGPANPRDPECRQSPEPLRALPSNSVKFRQILGLPGAPGTARQTSVKVWGVVGPLLPPSGSASGSVWALGREPQLGCGAEPREKC